MSIQIFSQLVLSELELTESECKEAGFNPETLKCSACDKLSNFNLDEIITDCQRCCKKEEASAHDRYPMAVIEVCECNLGRFPQVNGKSSISGFGGYKFLNSSIR